MKILAVGDVMGKPGRRAVKVLLRQIIDEEKPDFVIVNGENSAGGMGIIPETGKEMLDAGADVITSGNHIWRHKEVESYLVSEPRVLRPANYPSGAPGRGYYIGKARSGQKVAVLNLQGLVFMPSIDCPFRKAQELLPEIRKETDIIVVDMHAEATSEKVAMGRYLAGQVTFVYGTHTHVATADEQILKGGTAYITDIGMTGPHDSVIGMEAKGVLEKFLTQRPNKFEVASDDVRLNGALVEVNASTGQATAIKRIMKNLPNSA